MKIISNRITAMVVLMATIFFFLVITAPLPLASENTPEVKFQDGLLTVKAVKTPLLQVLESIGNATGVDIFVSKDLTPSDISIQFADEPLEEALKRVLRGLNYAAVYTKGKASWQITSLKVFPKGQYSGKVASLLSQTSNSKTTANDATSKTVFFNSDGRSIIYGKLGGGGNLIPSRSVPGTSDQATAALNAPWFQLQKQFERKEVRKYEELMLLEKKLEAARDSDRKDALAMAYADEVEKFYTMKKIHLNKIEALKRIYQAREMVKE